MEKMGQVTGIGVLISPQVEMPTDLDTEIRARARATERVPTWRTTMIDARYLVGQGRPDGDLSPLSTILTSLVSGSPSLAPSLAHN